MLTTKQAKYLEEAWFYCLYCNFTLISRSKIALVECYSANLAFFKDWVGAVSIFRISIYQIKYQTRLVLFGTWSHAIGMFLMQSKC